MKLHLPLIIRKSVLACLFTVSSTYTTVVSGAVVGGCVAWVMSSAAVMAEGEIYPITGNADATLTSAPAGSLIIMDLQGGWLVGPGTTHNVLADVQMDSLSITNGSSDATYNFSGAISGSGIFERTSNAAASRQTYVFTGAMSRYSGEMKLLKSNDGSVFRFVGNQSGTGAITIVTGNTLDVVGATMNNSSITTAGTMVVSGNATFAGEVMSNGGLRVSAGASLTNHGTFTFGENALINLAQAVVSSDSQRTLTYSILSSASTGTSNFDSLSLANITGVVTAGRTWSFNADGTLVGVLSNNSLNHSAAGDFTWNTTASSFSKGGASAAFTQGDDVTFTGTGTKVSFGEALTAQRITVDSGAEVEYAGGNGSLTAAETIVQGTLKLSKGGQNGAFTGGVDVYGSLHIATGDATGWSSTNGIKAINILAGGEMYVGTTGNQTGSGLVINLQGGSITGVANSNFDLGYGGALHGYSSISALAADGATAAQPTVSSIAGCNITLRQNHTTISVEENARLDIASGILALRSNAGSLNSEGAVSAGLVAGLVKTGAGELRLSGNNTYTQATTVAEGTLSLTGGSSLASSSVTVNDGALLHLATGSGLSTSVSGILSGNGTMRKTGLGSAAIGGLSDSFAGHIDLQQGTLSVGSPVVISSGRELSLGTTGAVLDSNLSLGDGTLSIDYSGSGAATSLNNSTLTLLGGTQLQLSSLAGGDGKTYELFSGISSLLGHDGSALSLNPANNAISNYFDTTRPGTGFWANGTLQLNDGALQLVLHNETVKETITVTTRQKNPAAYQYYAGVRFENIEYVSDSSSAYGGAIYGADSSTITLSANGSVSFSGNAASTTGSDSDAEGGAIYGYSDSTITLSNNGSVSFSGNSASTTGRRHSHAYGGAIYGADSSTITLSNNESVTFSENTASTTGEYSFASGGAIYGYSDSTITLSANGSVCFSENTASTTNSSYSASGGAIYGGSNSTISLSANGSVTFSGNAASSTGSDSHAYGGAIYGYSDSTITLSNNESVSFSGNTASGKLAYGGAIYGYSDSTITLSGNGNVSFSGNTVSGKFAYGGAIYGADSSTITLSGNDSVSFSGNTASSSDGSTSGGAILGDESTITLSGNGSVSFSGNTASSRGGAIYGYDITFNNNGSVTFSGNTASSGGAIDGSVLSMEGNRDVTFSGNAASSRGGAIYGWYSDTTITLSGNGSVTFSGNTASSGGAIYGDYSFSTITLSSNGSVVIEGNTASSSGGAIYVAYHSTIALSDNGSVTFSGNTASSGGAIYGYVLSMEGNRDVTFSGNTASSSGGAIDGSVTLTGNESVTFSGNTAVASDEDSYAEGGAIYGSVTLTGNESVTFSGNTAYSGGAIHGSVTLTGNESVTFSGNTAVATGEYTFAEGGAIDGSVTLTGNESVTFSGNTASSRGGAIHGSVTLTGNESVTFSGNTASSGGAFYGYVLSMEGNRDVTFSGNTASSRGGAIHGSVTLTGNESVTFSGNTAYSGGAIYGDSNSTITLSNNGSVTFSGNTASSSGGALFGGTIILSHNGSLKFTENNSGSAGGAIRGTSITLSHNGSVDFTGNSSTSGSSGAIDGTSVIISNNDSVKFSQNSSGNNNGGAITAGTLYLCDNHSVVFNENSAVNGGGAIYAINGLNIQNNDSVEFYQNALVKNGIYQLRSITANGGSVNISAAAGKSIVFRDSMGLSSSCAFNLNADYTDDQEKVHEQKGDIVFTGGTTVNDLYKVKGDVDGTEAEILFSRTSEINTMTNLYGGRLRVEDGAVYKGRGITVHEGSAATVLVNDAELSHVGYELRFNAGTSLEVAGNSTIRGDVNLLADSLFKLEKAASLSLHETLEADAAELSVQGTALLAGSATLNASLTLADGATLDMMSLDAGAVTLNGALTFGAQVEMGENLMAILNEMRGWEENVTLFTGIESLVLPQVVTSGDSGRVWVGNVFSNLAGNESYYIDFKADVGALLVVHVPEPTTTSLSLLVLAALAARRRRR